MSGTLTVMKTLFAIAILLASSGCIAVRAVDAAASTAVGVTKTTVKAGGAAIDATVDTFDADEEENGDDPRSASEPETDR